MRAMILAAGVGSRLAPITDNLPKPLIPVLGKPVLSRIIDLLKGSGFSQFIANTHYLGHKIYDEYCDQIILRQEDTLTGVAGGIRTCADFLRQANGTFAVIMGDALTDINMNEMLKSHRKSGCKATIALKKVKDTSQFGVVCFDENKKVISFQEKPSPNEALSDWANTGVYLFEQEILDYIPSEGEALVYDVAHDLFPKLLGKNVSLNAYETNAYWADLGNHSQYRQALFDCLDDVLKVDISGQKYSWGYMGESSKMNPACHVKGKAYIGQNCKIGRCTMKGHVVIEDNCIIEDDVELENCLVLYGSAIRSGCKLKETSIPICSNVQSEEENAAKVAKKNGIQNLNESNLFTFSAESAAQTIKVYTES